MAITAQTIAQRVAVTSQDITSVRWPPGELARYINDGQREVLLHRPDAINKKATITCVLGTRQTLPIDGTKLIEVTRNAAGSMRAVRLCSREVLDAQTPNWHSNPAASEILHFMYDAREPLVFWVYPPATTAASLEINYSAAPTDITEPTSGDYTSITGALSVPDKFTNALVDYVLYRMYSKDSEYAGNVQRAQAHYSAFAATLGLEVKGTVSVSPSSPANPNRQGAAATATSPIPS